MYDTSWDVLRREGYKGTIAVFKYLPGRYREGRVFLEVDGKKMTGDWLKLKEGKFQFDIWKTISVR